MQLSSFVAKWWNRLDAYSTADSPSLTEHTAITAVSILADVAAVAPFHDQLRHHIMTVSEHVMEVLTRLIPCLINLQKEGIGVICRLMQSEQKRLGK